MKELVLKAWAWVLANPEATMGAVYAVLNVVNSQVSVERRKGSRALQLLDRLCVLTQKGAQNATSWPVVGRSIAKAAVAQSLAEGEQKEGK